MNVTIKILGRNVVDEPFVEVCSATVVLAGDRLVHTPVVPPGTSAGEMLVRVEPDEDVEFALGSWLDPATRPGPTPHLDGNGVQVRIDPAPTPEVRHRKIALGRAYRDAPFFPHDSLILAPAGVAGVDLSPA